MALSVVSSPTPGATAMTTPLQGSGSVGAPAQAPASNLATPTNTISTKQQVPTTAVNDLSKDYASVAGANGAPATIYNKNTGQAYSTPAQFFAASGVDSFNNLKFDTSWTPSSNNTGAGTAPATSVPQGMSLGSAPSTTGASTPASGGLLPSLAASNTGTPTTGLLNTPTTATGAPAMTPPPNGGATGVSQGSIIGGQIANANSNPTYQGLINQIQQGTNSFYNTAVGYNTPNLASANEGIQGLLINAFNAKNQALQNAANSAINEQGQTNTGLSSAASANAPIAAGAYTSPSAPSTTGQTTSGGQSLNSLLTITPNATGPGTASMYSAGGQNFSTPQQLSQWVNQQVGNPNATNASNVFQYLQQNGNNGVTGGGGALNPLNNLSQTVQSVISGATPYATAIQQGSSIPGYQNALNSAITAAGGNLTQIQSQVAGQQSVLQTLPAMQSANAAAKGIQSSITSYLNSNPQLNSSSFNLANFGDQWLSGQISNPQYQTLSDYLNEYISTLAPVLGVGGDTTNLKTQIAQSFINSTANGGSIVSVLSNISSLADQKIANLQRGALNTPSSNSSSSVNIPAGSLAF